MKTNILNYFHICISVPLKGVLVKKEIFFNARSFLSIYETCTIFEKPWKIIFQSSKKDLDDIFFSMEYGVYWARKSSCFEIFGNRKYGLFWLMEDNTFFKAE